MIAFSLPLLLGNLFQQLYNLADTLIVGRFVGKEALAAVGAAGAVMNLMLFVLVGMTLGASVILAELFGAQDHPSLRRAFSSALIAGAAVTLLVSVLTVLLAEPLLRATRVPEEVLGDAAMYLRVIGVGLVFSFVYNVCAAGLRATGDSRTPLTFLMVSAALNVVLDLVFVAVLGWRVFGAAFATILSQMLSGVACLVYIQIKSPALRLTRGHKLIDRALLLRTAGYAWVCAVQQAVLYAGRLLVQGAVNPLGVDSIAAFNGATKIDSLVLAPGDSLAMALTTFTSQNVGAKNAQRPRQGLWIVAGMGLALCGAVAALVLAFAPRMMGLFVSGEADVVAIGARYLRVMAPFYLLTALCNAYQGLFRGLGRMNLSLISTLIQIPIRIALSYLFAPGMGLPGVALATGIGWCGMVAFITIAERRLTRSGGLLR